MDKNDSTVFNIFLISINKTSTIVSRGTIIEQNALHNTAKTAEIVLQQTIVYKRILFY